MLFVVHDSQDDPDGGVAVMRLKIEREAVGAHILVYDDPHGQRDSYEILEEDRLFISRQLWSSCCTDGVVLGPLTGLWQVLAEFPEQDDWFGTETISGRAFPTRTRLLSTASLRAPPATASART